MGVSNEKWINISATVNGKLDTIFRGVRVLNYEGLDSLANLILNPNPLESFFSKPDDWISTVMAYPFNIPLGRNGTSQGKLQLGLYDTKEKAFEVYKYYKEKNIKMVADYFRTQIPENLYNAMYNYIVEITD